MYNATCARNQSSFLANSIWRDIPQFPRTWYIPRSSSNYPCVITPSRLCIRCTYAHIYMWAHFISYTHIHIHAYIYMYVHMAIPKLNVLNIRDTARRHYHGCMQNIDFYTLDTIIIGKFSIFNRES